MSVEDSASDATGSSADSATGLALQLTLQPVWFFGRLGDRIGASYSLVTCLALRLTLCPGMNLLSSEENLGDERGLVAVRDVGEGLDGLGDDQVGEFADGHRAEFLSDTHRVGGVEGAGVE